MPGRADRAAAYAAPVAARKSRRACIGLTNPAVCDGGIFDSDQIGPWSLSQGNLNADLVIVGQEYRQLCDGIHRSDPS